MSKGQLCHWGKMLDLRVERLCGAVQQVLVNARETKKKGTTIDSLSNFLLTASPPVCLTNFFIFEFSL